MRLFGIIVAVLVGGFAVTSVLPLSLQVLVVLVQLSTVIIVIKYWNTSGTTTKYQRVQPPLKDEKSLNTTDLNKILTLLKKYQYSGKSYYHLGLSLGLLRRTLEIIKTDNNSIENCLMEVLTKWLEKADNVEEPTWSALVAAFRSINQNAAAEAIERETDPVSMIIEKNRHALSQSIQENLIDIARLLSYELKDKSLESLHGPPSEKIEALLKIVKNAVYENYKSILKFADVLCKFPAVRPIGNAIKKDYSETIVDNSIEVMGRNGDPIIVPVNFNLECKEMRKKWAIAVYSAISAIKAIAVEEQELKGFLQVQTSNSDVKEQLNTCESVGEIMQIVINQCSLVDLTLLEGIIEFFNIEEAKKHIDEYKETVKDFCSNKSLSSWLNETLGRFSCLQCETLQFSVDKNVDERTLKDVHDLTAIAFESLSTNVRVIVIKEGNSFTITCSFPLALSESLIATALKNLEQLKKEGLIKLTIGYSTVYSQNKVKVVAVEKFKKLISKIPLTQTWSTHLERKKSQYITAVYNSSGTMKQLLVSLTVQAINNEYDKTVFFDEEKKMLQELLKEKTALVKKVENENDIRIQELKDKQDEIEALQVSLRNATERENIAAEDKKELNEKLKTQLRISRIKDQEIENFKAAAIREKIRMTKEVESQIKDLSIIISEKDKAIAELQQLIMDGNENEFKQKMTHDLEASSDPESQIKYLNIIISEKDKTIAELQHLDTQLEDSSDSSDSSDTSSQPESIYKSKQIRKLPGGDIAITNPSLQTCQEVISKLKISKNHHYLLKNLSPKAARLLIPALLNTRNVEYLRIHSTPLTSDFILSLSSQLSRNESIWGLEFERDTIDDDGLIALVHSLKNDTRVSQLSVSYNTSITSVSVEPLKELILTMTTLIALLIDGINIDTNGALSLTETLKTNKKISIWLPRQHEKACSSLPYYDTIKKRLHFI